MRSRPERRRDALRRALLTHYDRTARALPWRGETDPYRVLVSEVMLQQTRVDTVKRYYGPWIERFPDVGALSDASEDEVLGAWEGLGYYRRARNLHGAARLVREAGAFPSDPEALRALPGVGEYTAGAVASIAFGRAAPAVDGNVRRVLSRLFDVAEPAARWLRDTAAALVDPARPGDWNQALMDLGATVCARRAPACGDCPVSEWCAARRAGTVAERPGVRRRATARTATFLLGVFRHEGRVLLVRRPCDGLLAGLWAFPEVELAPGAVGGGAPEAPDALRGLARSWALEPVGEARALAACAHRFTHLHATYLPWLVDVRSAAAEAARPPSSRGRASPGVEPGAPDGGRGDGGRAWIDPGAPDALALPVVQRRLLESLGAHGGSPTREQAASASASTPAIPRA